MSALISFESQPDFPITLSITHICGLIYKHWFNRIVGFFVVVHHEFNSFHNGDGRLSWSFSVCASLLSKCKTLKGCNCTNQNKDSGFHNSDFC